MGIELVLWLLRILAGARDWTIIGGLLLWLIDWSWRRC